MSALDSIKAGLLELAAVTLGGKDKEDFTLIINGTEIRVESARLLKTMDTAADGWTASRDFDPYDDKRNKLFIPYSYYPAIVYLGKSLGLNSILYSCTPQISGDGQRIELEGWTPTADAIDCTINVNSWAQFPSAKYERNNVTLGTRAAELLEPLGIGVIDESEDSEPFARVSAEPTDTIFDHLLSMASQRGILISCTDQGELLLTKAKTSGKPVGTIEEEDPPYQEMSITFDGRARYSTYRAIGQSPQVTKKNKQYNVWKASTVEDPAVGRSRFTCFNADESYLGNMEKAAKWKRNKTLADALTIPFPVSGWYAPDGFLYEPNTLITVKSPTLFLPDGFDFLIRAVEYQHNTDGNRSILHLVPPQVYSDKDIVDPWAPARADYLAQTLLEKLQSEL